MKKFLQNFDDYINGILTGFDRIILKGHIKHFYYNNNFYYFLSQENVKLKDFKSYVLKVTADIKTPINHLIEKEGCYTEYLTSTKTSKEKIAQRILEENPQSRFIMCALSCGAMLYVDSQI